LNLATTQKDTPDIPRFTEEGFFKLTKHKKKVSIDVNIDQGSDISEYAHDRKLQFVTQEMERMQFTGDTSMVLEVCLGEHNTYGDFVRMIERAKLYDVRRYAYIDDCFYFIPDPLPVRSRILTLELDSFPTIDIPQPPEPSKWDIFKSDLNEWFSEASYIVKHNYPLSIGFVVLILLPGGFWISRIRARRVREH